MDPIANARDEIDKPDFLIKKKQKKWKKHRKTTGKKMKWLSFVFK